MADKVLFICGSLNQTRMMHKISSHMQDYDCWFSPYYSTGFIGLISKTSLLNFSILGGQFRERTMEYLRSNLLKIDESGKNNQYTLVFTCSDLLIPNNISKSRIILVQEGMTDPENWLYYLVKFLKLPRWLGSTSMTGLSHKYAKFCVASEGYKQFFIRKGIPAYKIEATGIPNFDSCVEYLNNDFPYHNFVLAATSDARETFRTENRRAFIKKALKNAGNKMLIFKLHPNEKYERAVREIRKYAPKALVYSTGNAEEMVANCDILVTKYSTLAYVGLILGKKVFSAFNIDSLLSKLPLQNGGTSAYNISLVARNLLDEEKVVTSRIKTESESQGRPLLRNRIKQFNEKQYG